MNKKLLAHAAAAAAALSAGSAVVATRFVIGETDPISLVFYRYLISILCFVPILPMLWPRTGLDAVEYGKIAGFGILFFILFPWTFNAALHYNSAARGAVGLATIPIQTLLVAAALGRERITLSKAAGVLIAFSGIAVVFGAAAFEGGSGNSLLGDALMLLSGLCAALYSVFGRATLVRHGPLFVTALAMVFAVSALVPIVLLPAVISKGPAAALPDFSSSSWLAILFLGSIAGAVQFSLYMWALRWLPPTTTTLYLTLNPITAMVLGTILLREPLTVELVAGLVLVLTGILVGSGLYSAWTSRRSAEKR